jgi:hypothetical protein
MPIRWWGVWVAAWSVRRLWVIVMVVVFTITAAVISTRVVSSTHLAGEVINVAYRPMS